MGLPVSEEKYIELAGCDSLHKTTLKIIHIKRVETKRGYINVYWNNRRSEILTGSRVQLPVHSIAHIHKWQGVFDDPERSDIQIGDSVIYILNTHLLFALCCTVIGFSTESVGVHSKYLYLQANHPDVPEPFEIYRAPFEERRFIFVSNNLKCRKNAERNIAHAYYQDELELLEKYLSFIRVPEFYLQKVQQKTLSINSKLLKECHRIYFDKIYGWAGEYRKHEVVVAVGRREHPTSHPSQIQDLLKDLFTKTVPTVTSRIQGKKEKLADALLIVHKHLAKIHPFEDGNGRTIRMFLSIMAMRWGYRLTLENYIKRKKLKRYYHYAVGRAIKEDPTHLNKMIYESLSKI